MHFLRAPLILLVTTFVTTVLAANFTGNATLIHFDYAAMTADVNTFKDVLEGIVGDDQSNSTSQSLFAAFATLVSNIVQTSEDIHKFGPFDDKNCETLVTIHVLPIYGSLNGTLSLLTQKIALFDGFLEIPNFVSGFRSSLGELQVATEQMVSAIQSVFTANAVAQQAAGAQNLWRAFNAMNSAASQVLPSNDNSQ